MSDPLLEILKKRSIRTGVFTLTSGRKSDLYVDCKQTLLDPEGMALVGSRLFDLLVREDLMEIEAIAGTSVGGDPMVCSMVLKARQRGYNIPGLFVRKAPKDHGTQAAIDGAGRFGFCGDTLKVVLLEDVITTGGSTLRSINRLREDHFEVVAVFVLLDRCEGGREALEAEVPVVRSLFTRADVVSRDAKKG